MHQFSQFINGRSWKLANSLVPGSDMHMCASSEALSKNYPFFHALPYFSCLRRVLKNIRKRYPHPQALGGLQQEMLKLEMFKLKNLKLEIFKLEMIE